MKLSDYICQPWTVSFETVERKDGRRLVARIDELPGFKVIGRSDEELEQNFWDGLHAYLESMLQDGEEPSLPNVGRPLPPRLVEAEIVVIRKRGGELPSDATYSYPVPTEGAQLAGAA